MSIEGLISRYDGLKIEGLKIEGLDIIKITAFTGPVQIMRHPVSNNGQYQTSYPPYHRYKGLSSIPNLAGNRKDILDTKHSIYKHYRGYSLI